MICKVLAEIAEKERKKAIKNDNYGDALVASIFEESSGKRNAPN